MVHQIAINHSLSIAVGIYRLTKNLGGMYGRGSRKGYFNAIKIFNYRAIFALKIPLIPKGQLFLCHQLVQSIAPVSLIHNNQIKIWYRWLLFIIVIENPLYHTLNSGYLHPGFLLHQLVLQALDIIDFVKGHQLLQLYVLEHIMSLYSQGVSVYQKENPLEPIGFQKTVNHAQYSSGFACTSSHS